MFTKNLGLSLLLSSAVCLGYAAAASAHPPESPVTTTPTPLSGTATPLTSDSTLMCSQTGCGTNVGGSSTVTLGSANPPPPPPPPPPPQIQCYPGQTTLQKQSGGSCPAGTAAYTPYGGNAFLFTQTQTRTESCPSGIYGPPSYSYSGWVPASATDPSACGWPSGTNVQIGVNNQANFYGTVAGNTGSYPMGQRGGQPGGPHAQFSGTWTWNGQTMFVQVTCNGTELCTNNLVKTIGGVNWNFKVWGASLLPGDCMLPRPPARPSCPLNGTGTIGAQ